MNKLKFFISLCLILVLAACNDKLTERVITSFDNGQPTEVRYYNKNNQCVREVHYYDNGAVYMEGEIKDDVRNGEWTSYFEDGKVQSKGFFENDKRTGKSLVYYENGTLWMDGSYKEGKKVGLWIYYDEQGYVTDSIDYGM
jgi:antitoxin component YwqK of YwqJK toxin-antitoxin module